jgi:hypothetical protein
MELVITTTNTTTTKYILVRKRPYFLYLNTVTHHTLIVLLTHMKRLFCFADCMLQLESSYHQIEFIIHNFSKLLNHIYIYIYQSEITSNSIYSAVTPT